MLSLRRARGSTDLSGKGGIQQEPGVYRQRAELWLLTASLAFVPTYLVVGLFGSRHDLQLAYAFAALAASYFRNPNSPPAERNDN